MNQNSDQSTPAPPPESELKQATSDSKHVRRQKKDQPTKSEGNKKARGGEGSSKLRGLPRDSEETKMSKTLTWVLRHGSQAEKLAMRSDGYVRVQDILARPKFKDFSMPVIEQIVASDAKTRFNLISELDAASGQPVWWIRANQGHSIKTVADLETTPVLSVADIPTGVAVHGTTRKAWELIQKQGLSRMKRNHVHLAQGIPGTGVISGMRNTSQIYIYLDVGKAISSGLKFELSANGVILTSGNDKGFVPPAFFSKVVTQDGTVLLNVSPPPARTTVDDIQQKTEALVL